MIQEKQKCFENIFMPQNKADDIIHYAMNFLLFPSLLIFCSLFVLADKVFASLYIVKLQALNALISSIVHSLFDLTSAPRSTSRSSGWRCSYWIRFLSLDWSLSFLLFFCSFCSFFWIDVAVAFLSIVGFACRLVCCFWYFVVFCNLYDLSIALFCVSPLHELPCS